MDGDGCECMWSFLTRICDGRLVVMMLVMVMVVMMLVKIIMVRVLGTCKTVLLAVEKTVMQTHHDYHHSNHNHTK